MVSNSPGLHECVRSPVWIRKSGELGIASILFTADWRVPVTSAFAGLLKPMWLSLICTNVKSSCFCLCIAEPKTRETGTPAMELHTTPVPAHAMHLRKPRRSMPSDDEDGYGRRISPWE